MGHSITVSTNASSIASAIQAAFTVPAGLGQDVFGVGVVLQYTVPGTYYYRVPPNVYKLRISVAGAGGSGGAGAGLLAAAAGGGAGGLGVKVINVTPGDVYAVTVGKGGASVTCVWNQALSGQPGGASSFGAILTASGGTGGNALIAVGTAVGGVGGAVSGADYSVVGGNGGDAAILTGATTCRAVTGGGALYGYKAGNASAGGASGAAGTGGAGTGGSSGDASGTGPGNAMSGGGGAGSGSLPISSSSGTSVGTPGGNLSGNQGEDTTIFTFTARHLLDRAFRGSGAKLLTAPTVGIYSGGGGLSSGDVSPSNYNLAGGIGAGGGAFVGANTSGTGAGGNGGCGAGGGGATSGNGGSSKSGAGGDGFVIVEA